MNSRLLDIAQMVKERCGINFVEKLDSLERKMNPRLQVLGCDYAEYALKLKRDLREWSSLIELLTVHETYFFRESNHFTALNEVVMPSLLAKTTSPVRIWSAACSTGEEPYTVVMSLLDGGYSGGSFQVIATDIDEPTLDVAKKGWYSKQSFSFRRTPEPYRVAYFDEETEGYRVQSRVTKQVQFRQLNLLDDLSIRTIGLFDIIFCRNVLIYFDDAARQQVMRSMYDRLKPGGYLFLGHADHVSRLPELFTTVRVENAFFYQKGGLD